MKRIVLFLLMLCALVGQSFAAYFYGKLNIVSNIAEAGGLHATDGTTVTAPTTKDGYTFGGSYSLSVDGYALAWNNSLTINFTAYAIANEGYTFKGWASDVEGQTMLSTANSYTSSYVSTSKSQSSPTEHTIYAIFEKATVTISESAVPEAGKSYYLLNLGTSTFLRATADATAMTNEKSEATVFTFSGATSTTLSYTVDGETYYYGQSKGNFDQSQSASSACNWTIESLSTGGYYLWNRNGDNYNRYIMVNTDGGMSFARQKFSNPYRTWLLVDADLLVEAKMTITDAHYGTFIAPFDVQIPLGVSASKVDGVTSIGVVQTTEIADVIPANTPVIVYSETPLQKTFAGISTAEQDSYTAGLLTGVYCSTVAPVGSFVLQKQSTGMGFYVVESVTPTIAPNRCYLNLPPSAAKAFVFGDEE